MRGFICLCLASTAACVSSSTHQAALDDLERTRQTLSQTQETLDNSAKQQEQTETALTQALDQSKILSEKVSSMGANVDKLLGEKGELAKERERLASQVQDLQKLKQAAQRREKEFQTVMRKLHKMIDAGTLEVKIRNGRMLVQMSSDVVFPPAGTKIKPDAAEALKELAATMATFKDRRFQVMGHSDSTPIHTARFPSNWELSSQRAIEVVKLLVANGVPAEMLSAAGSGEFDPLAPNDTADNKSLNRRVEIVFLPDINELPGFGKTEKSSASSPNS